MKIQAVIFDMDGILIDSEPIWREVEIGIFQKYGLALTESECIQTMGFRVDEVVKYWSDRHPDLSLDIPQISLEIIRGVIDTIMAKGKPMPGVVGALSAMKEMDLKVALASSSASSIINAVVDKFGIRDYFEVIYSAENEKYGKPNPAVYLTTAEKLGITPTRCLAIEDSINGALSAKAAKMKCVAIPDTAQKARKEFGIADTMLDSLESLNRACIESFV